MSVEMPRALWITAPRFRGSIKLTCDLPRLLYILETEVFGAHASSLSYHCAVLVQKPPKSPSVASACGNCFRASAALSRGSFLQVVLRIESSIDEIASLISSLNWSACSPMTSEQAPSSVSLLLIVLTRPSAVRMVFTCCSIEAESKKCGDGWGCQGERTGGITSAFHAIDC
jgi:hypothetical protein